MSRERGSFGRRYWSSLTDVRYGAGATRERNWRGQPFWRRYLASFFVLPQPPRPRQKRVAIARVAQTHDVAPPRPQRVRRPWLLRYQSAVLAGAAVLAGVVVVTMRHQGGPNEGAGSGGATGPGTSTT
ncbi:hypothetical protein, partial [Catenulispora pinisilvae]|uniref:hypothetical protein n=1 Tax=Catenulispora pinisilvae TaxID=2705253 RepID=UPI0018912E78